MIHHDHDALWLKIWRYESLDILSENDTRRCSAHTNMSNITHKSLTQTTVYFTFAMQKHVLNDTDLNMTHGSSSSHECAVLLIPGYHIYLAVMDCLTLTVGAMSNVSYCNHMVGYVLWYILYWGQSVSSQPYTLLIFIRKIDLPKVDPNQSIIPTLNCWNMAFTEIMYQSKRNITCLPKLTWTTWITQEHVWWIVFISSDIQFASQVRSGGCLANG